MRICVSCATPIGKTPVSRSVHEPRERRIIPCVAIFVDTSLKDLAPAPPPAGAFVNGTTIVDSIASLGAEGVRVADSPQVGLGDDKGTGRR
jgi:hypothetical protein